MADLSGFDANIVKPNEARDPIPAGWQDVVIVGSEMKATSKGNGRYLSLSLQVANGPHQNRKLFDNLNLENPSEMAVQIAQGTLSSICRAVGVLTPKDSSELHNKILQAKVSIKKDQDGNPQNKIAGYRPRQAGPSVAPLPPVANQQQPVGAGASAGTGNPYV